MGLNQWADCLNKGVTLLASTRSSSPSPRLPRVPVVVLVVMAMVVSSCTRSETPGVASDDSHGAVCKLLTVEDFLDTVNVPPGTKVSKAPNDGIPPLTDLTGARWCLLRSLDPAPFAQVHVGLVPHFAVEVVREWKRAEAGQPGAKLRPVKGLGDEAVWTEDREGLVVRDGKQAFAIVMRAAEPKSAMLIRAQELARRGLERL